MLQWPKSCLGFLLRRRCADRAAAAESDVSAESKDVPCICTEPSQGAPVGEVATDSDITSEDLPSSDASSTHAADDLKTSASGSAELVAVGEPVQAADAVGSSCFEKDCTTGTSGPPQETPSHPEASTTPTHKGAVAAADLMPPTDDSPEAVAISVEPSGTYSTDKGTGDVEAMAVVVAIDECKAAQAEEQAALVGDGGDAASTIEEGSTHGSVEEEIPGANMQVIVVVRAPSQSCRTLCRCECISRAHPPRPDVALHADCEPHTSVRLCRQRPHPQLPAVSPNWTLAATSASGRAASRPGPLHAPRLRGHRCVVLARALQKHSQKTTRKAG